MNGFVANLWAASATGEFKSVNQTLTSLIKGEQSRDRIERNGAPGNKVVDNLRALDEGRILKRNTTVKRIVELSLQFHRFVSIPNSRSVFLAATARNIQVEDNTAFYSGQAAPLRAHS